MTNQTERQALTYPNTHTHHTATDRQTDRQTGPDRPGRPDLTDLTAWPDLTACMAGLPRPVLACPGCLLVCASLSSLLLAISFLIILPLMKLLSN